MGRVSDLGGEEERERERREERTMREKLPEHEGVV